MTEELEINGIRLTVEHLPDYTYGSPWEEEDGHGPVREVPYSWPGYVSKEPGERVLSSGRHGALVYDFREAVRIAKRDGWRAMEDVGRTDLTPGQLAERAATADFERLRRWCNDGWSYIGVVVTREDTGEENSLWGIESDSGDYLDEVALELARELVPDESLAA